MIAAISLVVAMIGIVPDIFRMFKDNTMELEMMQQTPLIQEKMLQGIQEDVDELNDKVLKKEKSDTAKIRG